MKNDHSSRTPAAPKFEYLRAQENGAITFDQLGKDGWEMVCVDSGTFYFKRPLRG